MLRLPVAIRVRQADLDRQYPPYLSSPAAANLSADDRVRYQEQARVVGQIVATFDERDFDHGSEARKRELKNRVQELMNEVREARAARSEQDSGSPLPRRCKITARRRPRLQARCPRSWPACQA